MNINRKEQKLEEINQRLIEISKRAENDLPFKESLVYIHELTFLYGKRNVIRSRNVDPYDILDMTNCGTF